MKKLCIIHIALLSAVCLAAPTANEEFVIAEDARTYTNAVQAAKAYTDQVKPGNYATVSNRAMNAVQPSALSNYATSGDLDNAITDAINDAVYEAGTNAAAAIHAATQAVIQAIPPMPTDYIPVARDGERLVNEEDEIVFSHFEAGDVYPDYLWLASWSRLALLGGQKLPQYISAEVSVIAQASSNYTDSAIAAFTPAPAGRSWNRPAEWSLEYAPVFTVESLGLVSFSTNECGMVFSNFTARTQSGLSARVYPVSLDGLAEATPLPVSLSIPGGTVEGAVVSVPSNGLYAVTGVNSRGEARRMPVPFSFGSVRNVETSAYVADEDGTARKAANDFSANALASMTDVGTAAYIGETNRFRVWRTIQPTFSWPGVGNTTPFAVAPRVMATAAHYSEGMVWTGALSLTNWVDGGSFTVTRGAPVKLAEWAATNGFTAADIAAAGDLSDIRMIPLTSGEIPTNCCPWFASVEWMAEHYGNLRGLCAWSITQGSWWHPPGNAMQWAIPVVLRGGSLTAANTWMSAGGLKSGDIQPRADIAAAIGVYNVNGWYEIRGGDSGKPVWICDHTTGARRDIIVSHFHTVGSGPNYAAAMPLIRAYCIAHGTNIKEMN